MKWQFYPKLYLIPWYNKSKCWYYDDGSVDDFPYVFKTAGWLYWQFRWYSK